MASHCWLLKTCKDNESGKIIIVKLLMMLKYLPKAKAAMQSSVVLSNLDV